MSGTKFQLAVYRYAKEHGKDPSQLKQEELHEIAISIRTTTEVLRDGAAAVSSKIKTSAGFVVPLFVYDERKARCSTGKCGHLMRSAEGFIVCGHCGCGGEFMESALKNAKQSCRLPPGQKLWDKYKDEKNNGL